MPDPLEIKTTIAGAEEVKAKLDAVAAAERNVGEQAVKAQAAAQAAWSKATGGPAQEAFRPLDIHEDATKTISDLDQVKAHGAEALATIRIGQMDAAEAAGKHGEKLFSLRGMIDGIGGAAGRMIGAFLGITLVMRLYQWFVEKLEAMNKAILDLANQSKNAEASLRGLAAAMPGGTTAGNLRVAERTIERLTQTGLSREQAIPLGEMMERQLRSRGGIAANWPLAQTIAGIAGWQNLSPDQVKSLMTLGEQTGGLATPEAFQGMVDKLQASLPGTKAPDIGALAQQLTGGAGALLGRVPLDQILDLATRAGQLPEAGQAESAMRAFQQLAAGNKELERFLRHKGGKAFEEMDLAGRMGYFAEVLGGPLSPFEARRLEDLLPDRNLLALQKMFTPEAEAEVRKGAAARAGAGEGQVREAVKAWGETDIAKAAREQAAREAAEMKEGKKWRLFEELKKESESAYKIAKTRREETTIAYSEEAWKEEYEYYRLMGMAREAETQAMEGGRPLIAARARSLLESMEKDKGTWNLITGYSELTMARVAQKLRPIQEEIAREQPQVTVNIGDHIATNVVQGGKQNEVRTRPAQPGRQLEDTPAR